MSTNYSESFETVFDLEEPVDGGQSNDLLPVFLSWDIKRPFCVEYSGAWRKYGEESEIDDWLRMGNEPSGLD